MQSWLIALLVLLSVQAAKEYGAVIAGGECPEPFPVLHSHVLVCFGAQSYPMPWVNNDNSLLNGSYMLFSNMISVMM